MSEADAVVKWFINDRAKLIYQLDMDGIHHFEEMHDIETKYTYAEYMAQRVEGQ